MKRIPSAHISWDDMVTILGEMGGEINLKNLPQFFKEARKVSATHRCMIATNQKQRKVVEKVSASKLGDASLMADVIYATRIKLKHIGVKKIIISDPAWVHIKALIPTVNQYCESFGIGYREGYIQYVNTGFDLMRQQKKANFQFAANWLLQRSDQIISTLEGNNLVKADSTPEATREIHDLYTSLVASKTGIYKTYLDDPANMVHFVSAKQLANELGADYESFIEAQFYALDFCNGIPRITDLYGDKAEQRLINYISKTGISLKAPSKQISVDWNQFKN